MYQAGIKNITLYENKNIKFNFHDPDNSNNISNITTQGSVIEILNNQLPEFEIKSMLGNSGDVLYEYLVKLFILEYTLDNITLIAQIKRSIYGWCPLIEYYDGTIKFYNSPLWLNESELKPHSEMSFTCELKSRVATVVTHFDYITGISTVEVYRADTTLLTADTTIYTADYEL